MPLSPSLIQGLRTGNASVVIEAPFAAHAYVLCEVARASGRPVVHVFSQDKEMAEAAAMCAFLAPDIELLTLPAWDTLPYDRVSPSAAITSARIHALSRLATMEGDAPAIILTTVNAITQRLPPRHVFSKAYFTIKKSTQLSRDALFQFLQNNGYQRVGKVMEAGEYAVRGSLIDLFPSGHGEAVRIDLFGDEVESLRRFDPLTQISDAAVDALELRPVSELLLQEDTIARFRTRYLELFGAVTRDDPLYESISAGRTYAGMEHWLPLFYEYLDTLADYCPRAIWSSDHRLEALINERHEAISDYYGARRVHQSKDSGAYNPIPPERFFLDYTGVLSMWRGHPRMTLTPFASEGAHATQLRLSPQLFNRRHEEHLHARDVILDYIQKASLPVILAANSTGSADRIHKMLGFTESLSIAEHLAQALPRAHSITVLPIEQGFTCDTFILLTEQDMFGERIIRTQKRKRKSEAFLAEAASFIEGELIVHREHGIGRFEGLLTVEVNDTRHDCLKLIYDGGDKLFLPVENIDLVSRYGASEETIALDKLGGVAWQRRKSSLKKRLKMAAEALIKVAAARAATPATVLAADAGLYDEFVARFPYSETEDQLAAIEDVRGDLAAGHAMDRLICGDVGFGKTEVALRAAFIAASAGIQVALIAPTTLLARQHYHTFSARYRDLPISVRMLSRLTSAKDAAEIKTLLPEGKVDIVIGTHALLAGGVQFKDLGLLIVDEEQHFGVAQKEKLKQLKTNIHVLTLSATPIPRTLQLSLSGVRELSLITTPPVDRLAVRTYVMPYDPVVLREAILREYHRGGKIFVVTPRVKYMAELQQKIAELVPEVKIVAAHGQMGAVALDKTMNAFYDGKYDVLISTSIIESGIDIPTANTMIIDRADMFGLSQLYQLRGRVGRSKTRAYAYLTLPHGKKLNREAERRLEVMQQLDTLGAGFQLASHDMDIRGFGNLLGEEQSGHVKEVGIELYQAMLEEAIADMKRRRDTRSGSEDEVPDSWSPQINLGMSVLIPESYVEDLPLRLSLYRRAASLSSATELEGFAAELVDRFGQSPIEVEHLIATLHIKILCKKAGIARLDAGPKGVVLALRNNKFANPPALLDHIAKHAGRIKLRADQTLFIAAETHNDAQRLDAARSIALEIMHLLPEAVPQAA
jgi:transcription-repair coupling factor (superfamily II helicase)